MSKNLVFFLWGLVLIGCSGTKQATQAQVTPVNPVTTGIEPMAAPEIRSPFVTARVKTEELSTAEKRVKDIIEKDGIHIIHFWAPWCGNSRNELSNGWYDTIEQYKDSTNVTFTFVTMWNDLKSGRDVLDHFAVPASTEELLWGDVGDSDSRLRRRKVFLGLPLTWSPTTWVFHKNGQLAYAFNFGEIQMAQLKAAIEGAKADWHH
jgi:thiol-disulfide isomerase/thioredoxin